MNGVIAKIVFRDLYLNFKCQTFQVASLTSTRSKNANITIAIKWEVKYFPSDGAIVNDEHHDVDLYFQDHEF